MSFLTADYDYKLPPELIASHPAPVRDQARMMLLDREKQSITHHLFCDIPEFVGPDDLLVLNNTKVIPARIRLSGGICRQSRSRGCADRRPAFQAGAIGCSSTLIRARSLCGLL
jgi:hypothetical protein